MRISLLRRLASLRALGGERLAHTGMGGWLRATLLRSGWLYVLWAAIATLLCARGFYRAMWLQTGGRWGAPLDDVFIHFDFARQTARGAFLEWAPGNGYSSGATSPLYALVLAVGYACGSEGLALLWVAAGIALGSVWIALLAYGRAHWEEGRSGWLLALPPLFFAVGAADWALWSGMEIALFVGLHGIACWLWGRAMRCYVRVRRWRVFGIGVFCMLLVATRPEAVLIVGVFALALGLRARSLWVLLLCVLPSVLFTVAMALVNRVLTGDSTAYGALVKLALYNPTMSWEDRWLDYRENLEHVVRVVLTIHVGSVPYASSILFALAVLPLFDRRRRALAVVLWTQVIAWVLLISLNGQVRWQNERYAMPAVLWFLVLAGYGVASAPTLRRRAWLASGAVGIGVFALTAPGSAYVLPGRFDDLTWLGALTFDAPAAWFWYAGFAVCAVWAWRARSGTIASLLLAAAVLADVTVPNVRTQRWFFGRACKNILEQQYALGRWLREQGAEKRGRVLVGDAGAIVYASDWKALDLIGLGGYHDVPFARAGAFGLGASLELLERLPVKDRPDLLAIFPSWWESLPTFFASRVVERFAIEGNVICGDFEHVVYEADWSLLGTGAAPFTVPPELHVIDELDVGDLVSERAHGYRYGPMRKNGKVSFTILRDRNQRDRFDAGRRLSTGSRERFVLRGARADQRAYVFVRSAPEIVQELRVSVGPVGELVPQAPIQLVETGFFVETPIAVEPPVPAELEVEIEVLGSHDWVDYHVYLAQ